MSRFTVWSPFDGQPVPVRNQRERDDLIHRGYLADPPEQPEEVDDDPSGDAGADGGDLPPDDKQRRVQRRKKPVAIELGDDTGSDEAVSTPVE